MKFKSTYFFALLVIGFAGYTYFFEFKKAQEEKKLEENGIKLARSLKQEDVNELTLAKGDKKIRLVKADKIWKLEEPLKSDTDSFTINSLVATVFNEKEEEIKPDGATTLDPKVYGLDIPAGYVELKTPSGGLKVFVSKDKSFDGRQFHAKKENDQKIYLVSSGFGELLDKPLKDLRNKSIFQEDIKPTKIDFTFKGKRMEFVKGKDGWSYSANKEMKLDPKSFDDWTNAIKFVKASDFSSEVSDASAKKKFHLDSPELVVKLTSEVAKPIEFSVSKEQKGNFYLWTSLSPIIYEVSAQMIKPVAKSIDHFRDKKFPFTFDEKLVRTIDVQKDNFKITLKGADAQWSLEKEVAGKDLDAVKVTSLIGKLRDLEGDAFLNKAAVGTTHKIVLKDDSGKDLLVMNWGNKIKEDNVELYQVKTNLSSEIVLVKAEKIDELPLIDLLKDKPKEDKTPGKDTSKGTMSAKPENKERAS